MMLEELREQVVFYGNEMLRQGLTLHTGGNVSARAGEYMVIKPSSVPYALIRPQDVSGGSMLRCTGPFPGSGRWCTPTVCMPA